MFANTSVMVTILIFWSLSSSGWGIVSVMNTSLRAELCILSIAHPERMPWVAQARTEQAPRLISTSAALQRVPAVSIISSTMMMFFPSISPMAVIEPTSLARSRVLWQIMTEASSSLAYALALLAPPMSGAAIAMFSILNLLM